VFVRVAAGLMAAILVVAALAACGGGQTKIESDGFQWPREIHISAGGSTGMAKYVSWAAIMEKDTGMSIRIVPEENSVQRFKNVQTQQMLMTKGGKTEYANVVEAIEGHATKDAGPFPGRFAWTHAIANSFVFVRGDSPIKTIYDIKKGTRWAVWSMQPTVTKVPRAILDWIQVPHDDIVWFNAGSYDACARAVAEGRADVMFGFPTSPAIYEASSAPEGIRTLDLDSSKDPAGAARFRVNDPMYSFGPILEGIPEARGHWGTIGYTVDITYEDAPTDLIYHIAKWLYENFDRYKDKYASNRHMDIENVMTNLQTTYLPVHSGTIKLLKELGRWTPDHDKRQIRNLEMVTPFIAAYQDAIKQAEAKGIEVKPTNKAWIDFWTAYKKEHKIADLYLHQSLTVE